MKELVGSIHIHSNYSDGSGGIPAIGEAAKSAGLDYVIITDHNTFKPREDGLEGWNDSLMVIIGCEINDAQNRNHYLILDNNNELPKHDNPLEYVHQITILGGKGVVAHPDEDGGFVEELGAYPWTEWRTHEFQGMELWNQMTEWKEGLTRWNKYWRLVHPRRYLRGPKPSTLARWDYLLQQRKVIGIGGPDAHAVQYKLFGFIPVCIYPYKVDFKLIRTHVLVPENKEIWDSEKFPEKFEIGKHTLLSNLFYGQAFISNYYLGDARGFEFKIETPAGILGMGDQRDWDEKNCIASVSCPTGGTIRLIRNGKVYGILQAKQTSFKIQEPGVYRVEVYRKNKCWILSNPIWLQSWIPDKQ